MKMPSSALWKVFEDGRSFHTVRGIEVIHCRDIGALILQSGRIVACDPQFGLTQEPFSFHVPPGAYPVFLSLVGDDREIALVMIKFTDGEPTKWRTATPSHFSVDSATGCIMDAKLARILARSDRFDRHWKRVTDEMEENHGLWANVCLYAEREANMIAFQTFGGDDMFASYLGYSENDELRCLVIDFFLEDMAIDEAD